MKNSKLESEYNPFLDFYTRHSISPVKQDLTNIELHYKRREKLYRTLGIPPIIFQNKRILDVGPGSGYNTLAFFQWGGKVDLVEPNETGRNEMGKLFDEHKIPSSSYNIFPCLINELPLTNQYQIIIAEGFIQFLENWKEIIEKLQDLCENGGIIVVTCTDDIGFFVEYIKRFIGHIISRNITDFNEKVSCLVRVYEQQLKNLGNMSRGAEDWVKDQILNPAMQNRGITMGDIIENINEDFDILGASQSLFVDYSWYKDIYFDYKKDFLRQYKAKRHNFFMVGMEESYLSDRDCENVALSVSRMKDIAVEYEKTLNDKLIKDFNNMLKEFLNMSLKIDLSFHQFVLEAIQILDNITTEDVDFKKYKTFYKTFGRSQQYISIMKKIEY